jgi:DNA-binding transcriptional regulator YhcF (GntR family)
MDGTVKGAPPVIVYLDLASPTPKYQQIVEQVKALIASGALPPGAPLPSVRQLAGDLGINVNTVVAAYRALDSEHLVLLRRGARAIIHPRLARPVVPPPEGLTRVRAYLEHVHTEALLLGISTDTLCELAAEVFRADRDARTET